MPLISRREDLEMLILLSLLFYQQICFAFEYTDELRMLANRVAQLERTIGKEQQNSVHGEFQSVNLELKSDIPHPDFSKTDNKPRIQETELHVPGKGTNDSKLKTCDDRIQALERTVRELSKLFKVQENDIQHIHNLEARLDEQEKIISYLRKHISENEINIQTFQNEEMIPKGIEIKESDASLPNETGISKIQRIKEKNSPSVANINKKRLLSPVTTTPYPSTIKPIAFYAYMSQHTPAISIQHPLSFDVVKANFGNGYHSTTGVFMVPESGVYVFTWTIRIGDNYHHSTQLMVNTDELGIIYSHVASGSDVGGTGTVVAHVNKGDDVYVRTHASWNSGVIYSNEAGRSSFAGWKLF